MSRKGLVGIILILLVLAATVALVLVPARSGRVAAGDAVAVVHLAGPIQDSVAAPFGAVVTPVALRERLETAESDPRVRAVVLRLDTPGGTVAASQEMAALIADFPLPVVVSMGDVAASGGYYIAASADRIVAQPGTLTGSIGVILTILDVQGLLDKIGVKYDAVTAGEHKDMLLPGRLTPERRAILQVMADQLYGQFVTAVAEGRGLAEQDVRALATGQPYTGAQALELGLVDALGGLETAVDQAEELAGIDEAELVELRPSFFELFFGGSGGVRGSLGRLVSRDRNVDDLALLRTLLDGLAAPRYGGTW
ncbi:MAG: signal peptide peptidase SppA [Actinomycetota bacterium]|nr:signal peptide peptidase SppA [Actinomycetota bacterium]